MVKNQSVIQWVGNSQGRIGVFCESEVAVVKMSLRGRSSPSK